MPYLTLGTNVDLNGLDGTATVVPDTDGLSDFSALLHQDEPMLFADIDIDDALGKLLSLSPEPTTYSIGTFLKALDQNYEKNLLFGAGIDFEASLLSVNLLLEVTPVLQVGFDVQNVVVTLTASTGETHSGHLGDAFTFAAPADNAQPLTISSSYALEGDITESIGLMYSVGFDVKAVGVDGTVFGLSIPGLFPDSSSDSDSDPDSFLYSNFFGLQNKELLPDTPSASHAVSFDLAGKSYSLTLGDHTDSASVTTPVAATSLSVSLLGVDVMQQSASLLTEGDTGSRPARSTSPGRETFLRVLKPTTVLRSA